jgi:hypothetical protein
MIRFNERDDTPLRLSWPKLHPDVTGLVAAFAHFSEHEGLPDPVVTDTIRKPASQVRIYTRFFKKLQHALKEGPHKGQIDPEDDGIFRPLTPTELVMAQDVAALTDEQLSAKAGQRFSWHMVNCAVDLRTRHYSRQQLIRVREFFEERCPKPKFELLFHDVTAPHLHVARRDMEWKTRLLPQLLATAEGAESAKKPVKPI